jgi:hypothetical protein
MEVPGSMTRVTARASPTGITLQPRNSIEGLMFKPRNRGKPIAGGQKAAVRNWRVTREVWVAARAVSGIGVDREVGRADLATVGASGLEEVGTPQGLREWAREAILGVRVLEVPQAVEERPEQEGGVAPVVVAGGGKVFRCND